MMPAGQTGWLFTNVVGLFKELVGACFPFHLGSLSPVFSINYLFLNSFFYQAIDMGA